MKALSMACCACVIAVLAMVASPVPKAAEAATANGLYAAVRDTKAQSQSLGKGSWNLTAETALVDKVDRLADDFHELVQQGASLESTSRTLLELIEKTRERYTKQIEALQAEVIRVDGDLEAVQDSAAWRDRELLGVRLLYRENWVRYEFAVRYERSSDRRKSQLRKARDGFTQFTTGGDATLTNESLFGRGLCAKGLREYNDAAADFKAVLSASPSPELVTGVRVALAEVELARGNVASGLDVTAKLLSTSTSGEAHKQAVFLRAKALLLANNGKVKGSDKTRASWRREAAKLLQELYRAGSYWRNKAVQLIDAGIQNPASWAGDGASPFVTYLVAESTRRRGECASATKLYEDLVRRDEYTDESHYGIGFCAFHNGNHQRARTELKTYLDRAGLDAPYRTQAAYLVFKSAEAEHVAGNDAQAEDDDADADAAGDSDYLAALNDYLEIAPEHDQAFEAWFRLGEWHRDRGDSAGCAEAFGNVEGDPAFTLKASFLAAQCATQAATERSDESELDPELVRSALARVDSFLARLQPPEQDPQADAEGEAASDDEPAAPAKFTAPPALALPMQAKAVVMGAALVAKAEVGTMNDRLARLEGFEERFPESENLLPEVHSLRIVAHRRLGDLDAAGKSLENLLALEDTGDYGAESLKKLGLVFLKEASSREEAEDLDGAVRARKTALRIYERLLDDTRQGRIDEPRAGLQQLVEDLRASTAQ
ncbi:MAG: hypothetical protein ACI8TX_001480 [Hyphomicrobiaceae bacterium]|jgi:hypothetical protein